MTTKIAINGFGRIGRLVLRTLLARHKKELTRCRHQRHGRSKNQRTSVSLRHHLRHLSRHDRDR